MIMNLMTMMMNDGYHDNQHDDYDDNEHDNQDRYKGNQSLCKQKGSLNHSKVETAHLKLIP